MRRQSDCIMVMTSLSYSNRHAAGQDKQQELDHNEVDDSNMESREECLLHHIIERPCLFRLSGPSKI